MITGFSLPPTRDRSQPPPPWVLDIISRVQRHLTGEMQDFADLPYSWAIGVGFPARGVSSGIIGETGTDGELRSACRRVRPSFHVKESRPRIGRKSLAAPNPLPSVHWS